MTVLDRRLPVATALQQPQSLARAARLELLARDGEVVLWGLLAVLGAAAAAWAPHYRLRIEGDQVGPGLIPFVAGLLVALLCGAACVQAARRAHAAGPPPAGDDVDIFGRTRLQRVRMLWVVFGLLLATLLLVQAVGLLVAFGLFVLVVSTAIENRPLPASLLIAGLAVAVVYAIFVSFLGVPLPGGALGLS
jgi:putative tricarboxylic transport membrane protein